MDHDMKGISNTPRLARRLALAGMSALTIAVLAACSGGHAQDAAALPAPESQRRTGAGQAGQPMGRVR